MGLDPDVYISHLKIQKEIDNVVTSEELETYLTKPPANSKDMIVEMDKSAAQDEKVKKMFKKTAISDASTIIEYLLIALLGGVLPSLPPRRSLDMALLKIRNYFK
jgi:hypothetical protein